MSRVVRRRAALQAGFFLGLGVALPRARACEFVTSNLRVTHPSTRATRPDEDSALVAMRIDRIAADDRLVAVQTPVARGAVMGWHGQEPGLQLSLPAGREVVFGEGQALLRLTGLTQPLEATCAYPFRLVFAHSEAVDAQLTIDFGPRFS